MQLPLETQVLPYFLYTTYTTFSPSAVTDDCTEVSWGVSKVKGITGVELQGSWPRCLVGSPASLQASTY